jgi:hypothetical protein
MAPPVSPNLTYSCPNILDFNPASSDMHALRASLRSMESENNKFQACIAIRNKLLVEERQSKWLLGRLNKVMAEECYQYRKHEELQPDADFDARQWERFIDVAQSNIRMGKQCLAPLAQAADYWGMDKVHYYEWASMGRKYCKTLASAASRNPVWEEALVKLNQLLLKKTTEGRPLKHSTNPVYLLDLEHLIAWPDKCDFERKGRKAYTLKYEPIVEADLPPGYAFDRYGLVVPSHLALPAAAQPVEVKSTSYLCDSESEATTTAPPYNPSSRRRSYQILHFVTLLWCILLAVLSWWYRRMESLPRTTVARDDDDFCEFFASCE